MPIKVNSSVVTGQVDYGNPFVGRPLGYIQMPVVVSGLTSAEVDANGFIKPGVPLRSTGALISGASQVVYAIVPEPTKVALSNSGTDLTAAGTQQLGVCTIGQVNKKIVEDNLGRVLSANEIAGFDVAGTLLKLIS